MSADRRLAATRVRLAIVACSVLLTGCSWFTDFKQQPKIDPWESASDTIPFRGNPQSSVPIYGSDAPGFMYSRTNMPASIMAMSSIPNPTPADSASVNRGRINFQINCAVCHGPLGQGNGPATRYGMVGMNIGKGSLAATQYTDGYIFGMIRNGRGLMPSYNRIEEPDRWDIINYLRTLQGKSTIAADTSHGLPGETGAYVPAATQEGPTRPSPYYHPTSGTAVAPTAAMPSSTGQPAATPRSPADTTKQPERQP